MCVGGGGGGEKTDSGGTGDRPLVSCKGLYLPFLKLTFRSKKLTVQLEYVSYVNFKLE